MRRRKCIIYASETWSCLKWKWFMSNKWGKGWERFFQFLYYPCCCSVSELFYTDYSVLSHFTVVRILLLWQERTEIFACLISLINFINNIVCAYSATIFHTKPGTALAQQQFYAESWAWCIASGYGRRFIQNFIFSLRENKCIFSTGCSRKKLKDVS